MEDKQEMFEERYRKVLARHRQLSRGYVTRLGKNGVIDHQPIPFRERNVPMGLLALPVLAIFVVKGGILYAMGDERYAAQVALLADGSFGERMGAIAMGVDPLTRLATGFFPMVFG